jgi:hypothetical protein
MAMTEEMTLLDLQGMEQAETDTWGASGHGGGGESELSLTGCNGHSGISILCDL